MNTLREILMEIDDSIAWEQETELIDDRLLDSFAVISLISEIEDTFSISIDASEMVPENFNSVEAMYDMILRLQGE